MNHVTIHPKGITGRYQVEVDGVSLFCRKVDVHMSFDEIPTVELESIASSDVDIEYAQVFFSNETILDEVKHRMPNLKFQCALFALLAEFEKNFPDEQCVHEGEEG